MDKKDKLDSFWDISKLIPKKKANNISPFSTKEKTVTVTLDGDCDENSQRKLSFSELKGVGEQEERTYFPSGNFIKKVTVTHCPDKFDFHAAFKKAAELYFDFQGTECEFASYYSYMPQYTQLTVAQKNYYFYWRGMLRRGKFIKTDYSYFYLLVYEILNLPEKIPPEQGRDLLIDLWKNYRKTLPNIDNYMTLWVQDYCLVYGLNVPIDRISDFIFEIMSASKFKEFYFSSCELFGDESIGALIAYLSDYDWRKGKYSGGDSAKVYSQHLLGAMRHFFNRTFKDRLVSDNGEISVRQDSAFRMALTTCPIKYRLRVEYRQLSEDPEIRAVVTAALKYTENKLRALMGVKSRLTVKDLPHEYSCIIDDYFETLFAAVDSARKKASRPEYERLYEAESIEISMSGADEIEQESWHTTARLIVDDTEYAEDEDTKTQVSEENREKGDEAFLYGLSRLEIEFVYKVFISDNEGLKKLIADCSEMADSVMERVNEAFADNFGDVIIESDGEEYFIISDYREDVEQWITKVMK